MVKKEFIYKGNWIFHLTVIILLYTQQKVALGSVNRLINLFFWMRKPQNPKRYSSQKIKFEKIGFTKSLFDTKSHYLRVKECNNSNACSWNQGMKFSFRCATVKNSTAFFHICNSTADGAKKKWNQHFLLLKLSPTSSWPGKHFLISSIV